MILVESIDIKEFRGIRELSLDLRGVPFAICGPNGTGKSGVVDALEFGLTGQISRLVGEGKAELSVKEHGPHVDARDDPGRAVVTLVVRIPELQKTATIERAVKTPTKPVITPNEPDVLSALQAVERHPEVVLSRRELIRYVLATPGKRAEEVQALLRLDQIETVRLGLQKIANACEKQHGAVIKEVAAAKDKLQRALGVADLSQETVLTAASPHRSALGLPPLLELTSTTSLKNGLASTPKPAVQKIPKSQALDDITAGRAALDVLVSDALNSSIDVAAGELAALAGDPIFEESVTKEVFIRSGLSLIVADNCPLCDLSWDIAELKAHLNQKLKQFETYKQRRTKLAAELAPVVGALETAAACIRGLTTYASSAQPAIPFGTCITFINTLEANAKHLAALSPLSNATAALKAVRSVPAEVTTSLDSLEKFVRALPDPSKQDAAIEWLSVAQERLDVYRDARRRQVIAKGQSELSRKALDLYTKTSDNVLSSMYNAVQADFAKYYAFINRDDEAGFKARLTPSMGKLGFNVDFYGRGFFPPGAYHSEGHQDGMGLCLYLALMKHLQGSHFTLAVLDDVVMSVDTGHRREVCALLKSEFPKTQFVITTHDPVWLKHMRTEGLINFKSGVQFRKWSVDQGPVQWDDHDVWAEIDEKLGRSDVRDAAALLRHHLEYTGAELCHRLRALVPFRADGQYQLVELLPPAVEQFKALLKRATAAANSFNQQEIVDKLKETGSRFQELVNASKIESWQVNVAVHFNAWENLNAKDFKPVAEAYTALLEAFKCADCGQYLRVSPERETSESLRCDCGLTNINLLNKK